jgi:hypothetical protein
MVTCIVNIFLLQIFILQSNKRDMDYSYPSLFQDSFVGRNRYHLNNYYRCIVVFKGWLLSLILCVVFSRSLFVLLSFFFWPLCCLSFSDYPFGIFKLVLLTFNMFGFNSFPQFYFHTISISIYSFARGLSRDFIY